MNVILRAVRPLALLAAVSVVGLASAQQGRTYLNIGDAAPALSPAKWLKGTPVTEFEKGKIYVVEFWATWCGPCKENIPHLTELAKKYAGKVSISGISIWESNDPKDSSYMTKVEKFVVDQGDKMDYNVAVDGPDRKVGDSWMKAADESGIPMSFIVGRDGKIAWMGHPASMEQVLTQVIDDKFDVAAARQQRAVQVEQVRPIREAMTSGEYKKAIQLIDAVVAKKPQMERAWTYDRLVALYHLDLGKAKAESEKILTETQGEIGAYRMIASIFASQKDLKPETYRYGKTVIEKALAKNEMKYMFLAMHAEVCSSLGDLPGAVKSQEAAVKEAEVDPHAPAEFVAFLKRNLETFREKAKGGK